MLAVSWVLLTKVVEFTVMPPAENVAAAPLENPVPEIVMFWLAAPWPREAGLVEETVGAETTVKQLAHEPIPASGLVIVTALLPVMIWLLAPRPLEDGFVEHPFAPGFTVKEFEHEPLPASPFGTVRSPGP